MEAGTRHAPRPASPGIAATGIVRRGLRRARVFVSAAIALFLGLLPHILHHVGPLAGAAVLAGAAGSLLFGAIGLVAAIPFLIRLHRRYRNWRVPAAMVALFTAMFSVSAFVIGPAISGDGGAAPQSESSATTDGESGHAAHH